MHVRECVCTRVCVCICLYTVCFLAGYLTIATVAMEMAVGVYVIFLLSQKVVGLKNVLN